MRSRRASPIILGARAERIWEYCEIPEEPPAVIPDSVPPEWPSKGQARGQIVGITWTISGYPNSAGPPALPASRFKAYLGLCLLTVCACHDGTLGRCPHHFVTFSVAALQIEFCDVKMRYRPGLPLVLKGLTVTIPAGSKAGVVGRTGTTPRPGSELRAV